MYEYDTDDDRQECSIATHLYFSYSMQSDRFCCFYSYLDCSNALIYL